MSIAIYARQSVEKENSISCETQIEYCKSMLKPDERNEKLVTFIDNGFSGGNTDREGFQKMMRLVRQGKVKKVIVYKLDRISRSMSDFLSILQEFKSCKVEFVSSQESFDTSSPYGELGIKLLMVFAEFERTSIIERVTQAYAHRSEMGFYMGGRQPYGFELVPTVIHGINTKKLEPIPSETEQVRYIYEVYSQENISLGKLRDILVAEGKEPLNGSAWTTSKLSSMLKNPIYVKADSDVYDYYLNRGTQITADVSEFTGEFGAQLYGHSKHKSDNPDWSDMKLVMLTHKGVVDSDVWLRCQHKLEKNKQITNSFSNPTSWLAGKVICAKCGHTMTTVKGKANKNGEVRRYFNCTGKAHKKICKGPKCSVYAEDLENMIFECISEKFSELKIAKSSGKNTDTTEMNELKLKLKSIEKTEQQLMESIMSGDFNEDLVAIANQKATQLKRDKNALLNRIEELKSKDKETDIIIDFSKTWKNAGYDRKKSVAMILIHKILIHENGDAEIVWNL